MNWTIICELCGPLNEPPMNNYRALEKARVHQQSNAPAHKPLRMGDPWPEVWIERDSK